MEYAAGKALTDAKAADASLAVDVTCQSKTSSTITTTTVTVGACPKDQYVDPTLNVPPLLFKMVSRNPVLNGLTPFHL